MNAQNRSGSSVSLQAVMSMAEIALERCLQEKHRRGDRNFAHIVGRVPVEDLAKIHLQRSLVEWMSRQLRDIGVNSTGGTVLLRLHIEFGITLPYPS